MVPSIFDYINVKEVEDEEKRIFVLEEKSLGKAIGHIIFHKFNEPLEYELGWIINRKFHGNGYAKEASLALFEYGFNKLHLKSILAETVWDNKKSIATIISLGMKISEINKECWNKHIKLRYCYIS